MLTEKCKIVCLACKWDYQKKDVQVKFHIAHLKAKHGGFTPSMVDGQNSYENLIPKVLEVGEKEQERGGCRQQQQTKANNNDDDDGGDDDDDNYDINNNNDDDDDDDIVLLICICIHCIVTMYI